MGGGWVGGCWLDRGGRGGSNELLWVGIGWVGGWVGGWVYLVIGKEEDGCIEEAHG